MYQTGGTIRETIDAIQRHEYVLPAIQREFVWKPPQISRLFDSLMQGYPIGTFLFWRVDKDNARKFRFYDFVRDYHEKDNPHCPRLPEQRDAITAVLDGQQRLTALNIGLCGSMAVKQKNKWWNNPEAFPTRRLYLDLLSGSDPDEEGELYRFDFLTRDQIKSSHPSENCWFEAGEILDMEGGPDMLDWVNERLPQDLTSRAYRTLDRLHRVVQTDKVVAYYEEKSQDLSKVLNIFIRMNSGGTVLSYSDLLLSIAVAQWKRLDAREEIHKLVDELNNTGEYFNFPQDLVLKAGLVLTDIGNVGFKVENFSEANMKVLEKTWPKVRAALVLTVRLFASFGYNGQNLRATSVILPVAYYLFRLEPGDRYLTTATFAEDRRRIETWVSKSLLKPSGIWGSGLDTLLTYLRETIRTHGERQFPVTQLEAQMARRGKSLAFEEEEIEELLDLKYGKAQTFSLLSLLFPFVNQQNQCHVDHVFPSSRFHKSQLRKQGFSEEEIEMLLHRKDQVANLQLLDGAANREKSASLPTDWIEAAFPDADSRAHYEQQNLLWDLPDDLADFNHFYDSRRSRLRAKLRILLMKQSSSASEAPQ